MAKKKEPDTSKLNNLSFGKKKSESANPEDEKKEKQTFTIKKKYLKKLKRAAYWDRESQSSIIERALEGLWDGKEYDPIPGEE